MYESVNLTETQTSRMDQHQMTNLHMYAGPHDGRDRQTDRQKKYRSKFQRAKIIEKALSEIIAAYPFFSLREPEY